MYLHTIYVYIYLYLFCTNLSLTSLLHTPVIDPSPRLWYPLSPPSLPISKSPSCHPHSNHPWVPRYITTCLWLTIKKTAISLGRNQIIAERPAMCFYVTWFPWKPAGVWSGLHVVLHADVSVLAETAAACQQPACWGVFVHVLTAWGQIICPHGCRWTWASL